MPDSSSEKRKTGQRRKKSRGVTLADFVDKNWIPWAKENQGSWRLSLKVAKTRVLPTFGDMPLTEITAGMIRDWIIQLKNEGYAAATCNRFLCVLKTIFNVAAREKFIAPDASPADQVACQRLKKTETRSLEWDELKQIIDALEASPSIYAAPILLMIYSGASKSAILDAKWENFYPDANLLLHDPENGRKRRILLPPEAMELIGRLESGGQSDWLFPGRDGKSGRSDIFLFWNETRQGLGMPGLLIKDVQASYRYWRFRLGERAFTESVVPEKKGPMRISHERNPDQEALRA